MIVSYQKRTELLARIICNELNPNQLKFIMYLYRITVECGSLEAKIPSLNEIAVVFSAGERNFRRDIADLVERSIIIRCGKEYGFNFDFEIITKNRKIPEYKKLINDGIHRTLKRRMKK